MTAVVGLILPEQAAHQAVPAQAAGPADSHRCVPVHRIIHTVGTGQVGSQGTQIQLSIIIDTWQKVKERKENLLITCAANAIACGPFTDTSKKKKEPVLIEAKFLVRNQH